MIWSIENENLKRRISKEEFVSLNEISNDQIFIRENHLIIPCNILDELSSEDFETLNLPDQFSNDIALISHSSILDKDYNIKISYYQDYPYGNEIENIKRDTCLINVAEQQYLIPFNLSTKLDEIESNENANKRPPLEYNYVKTYLAQTLIDEYQLKCSDSLKNEKVEFANSINVDFEEKENSIKLITAIKSPSSNSIELDLSKRIRKTYRSNDHSKLRVVLDETVKQNLEALKDSQNIKGWNGETSELANFLKDPVGYLEVEQSDELIFDFSKFYGDRVIGIGEYKPKYYSFLLPSNKGQWIPAIKIENKDTGDNKRITVKDEPELILLKDKLEQAKQKNSDHILWKNEKVKIEDVQNILPKFKKLIEKSNNTQPPERSEKPMSLLIHENTEELTYTKEFDDIELHESNPIFEKVRNLKKGIELYDYQKAGVAHFQVLFKNNFSGVLLADDMGLGKTLQVLYFLEWYAQRDDNHKPCIIVSPVSLLQNWKNEYQKFFDSRSYGVEILKSVDVPRDFVDEDLLAKLQTKRLILTNYETFRNCQLTFAAVSYGIVVLDEAQKIKTPNTQITTSIKAVDDKAEFKIAMTGTPVENTLIDIWSIIDFIYPSLLHSAKTFHKLFHEPIAHGEDAVRKLKIEELKRRIGQLYIRRTKEEVLKGKLPEKVSHVINCDLTPIQVDYYNQIMFDFAASEQRSPLPFIHKIKLISDCPYLLDRDVNKIEIEKLVQSSGRLTSMVNVLKDIESKQEKVIVFTEYRKTQNLIRRIVLNHFGLHVQVINGETKNEDTKSQLSRQSLIDKFQSTIGFNIIIMSPIAAGVGLNVVSANHVIHYSRHWNPAKEAQATDRVYRIGQTKDVHIYNLISTHNEFDSFDVLLDGLLKKKSKLAKEALHPSTVLEVDEIDLVKALSDSTDSIEYKEIEYELNVFNELEPLRFESAIATLFSNNGYDSFLTPITNDKGADIVCIKGEESLLIQVKKSNRPLNINPIQEILGAKATYDRVFEKDFSLLVISNSTLNSNARNLALDSKVIFNGLDDLSIRFSNCSVSFSEINEIEKKRIPQIK